MKLNRPNKKSPWFIGVGGLFIIIMGFVSSCTQKQNLVPNIIQPTSVPSQLIAQTIMPTFISTATSTSTPSPTPTPIYIHGAVLFEDDFEDNSLSEWRIPVGTPVWKIEQESDGNKVLVGGGQRGEEYSISNLNSNWTNYSLEFNIKVAEMSPDFRVEFAFRIEEPCNDYVIGQSAGFGWSLVTENGCGTYNQIAGDISGYDILNKWTAVRIEVFRSQIAAFVDGRLICKTEDTDHVRGGISFTIISRGIVEIDNVNIVELVSR